MCVRYIAERCSRCSAWLVINLGIVSPRHFRRTIRSHASHLNLEAFPVFTFHLESLVNPQLLDMHLSAETCVTAFLSLIPRSI